MTFPRQSLTLITPDDIEPVAKATIEQIRPKLYAQQRILWLVSGGSAVYVAIEAIDKLNCDLSGLSVGLIDERYGEPGHSDSNYRALSEAGFDGSILEIEPVITGQSVSESAVLYSLWLNDQLDESDFTLGLFGIGADGHTAGLLPDNPINDSAQLYDHFQADDYLRLSATPKLIRRLDAAVVYAVGDSKWPVLQRLFTDEDNNLPANVLSRIDDLRVFSDVKLDI